METLNSFDAQIMAVVWTIILGLLGYLFLRQSAHDTKIKLAETNISNARTELDKLVESIDKGFENIDAKMDKIEKRFDMFISAELTTLKEIAKK